LKNLILFTVVLFMFFYLALTNQPIAPTPSPTPTSTPTPTLSPTPKQTHKPPKVSRGAERENRILWVTAYWNGSCGKSPSHRLYGVTTSGQHTKEWYTVSCNPKELPLYTKVYIPYFRDKPNRGIFTVTDTGVERGKLDIYILTSRDCFEFGRKKLEVIILE
jgi:3D (Asp-Asp-Asp) domain-containing protein